MTKKQKIETKIYELLGVKIFKKLVFRLEKIIHRKDKGQNINYHIKNSITKESIDSFRKYLYFNGYIHTRNIIKGIAAIFIMIIFSVHPIFVIILSLLLIKDAYCIMLQRYNWIKLNCTEDKLNVREERQIVRKISKIDNEELKEKIKTKCIDEEELIEELKKLRNYLLNINNDNCILNDSIIKITDITKKDIKSKVLKKRSDNNG